MLDFSTKELLQMFDHTPKPQTFLNDTFFGTQQTFVTDKVEVQYRDGNRKMAPFVSPLLPGKVGENTGYQVAEYKPPTLKPARVITAEDLKKASFGENVYSTKSPEERQAELLAKNWIDMENEIQRTLEYMSASILFKGYIDVVGDGVFDRIDFNFTNKVALAGTDTWDNYSTDENGKYESNPIEDLEKWRLQVLRTGGGVPNICVMSHDVASIFMQHPAVKETLDNRRNDHLSVKPEYVQDALMYLGTLSSGLEIYTYNEWIAEKTVDEFGEVTIKEESLVPEGQLMLGSTQMQGKTAFGAVTMFEQGGQAMTYEAPWVPRMIGNTETGMTMKQELISNPLVVPDNLNGWLTARVIGGDNA